MPLLIQSTNPHADRALRFLAVFSGTRPAVGSAPAFPDADTAAAAGDAFVERLLEHLATAAAAADRGVRTRACGLLAAALNAQGPEGDLSSAVADRLQSTMTVRLLDKAPGVRSAAAAVLARLADPGETGGFEGDAVTGAYLALLAREKAKEVRRTIIASLAVCDRTLPALIARTRDVDDSVRRAVYLVLAEKVPLAALTMETRALLLSRGLGDRSPPVLAAARGMLERWLDAGCEGDVGVLLGALDVEAHEAEAEAALEALDAAGRLRPEALARAAADAGAGLRRVAAAAVGGGGDAGAPRHSRQAAAGATTSPDPAAEGGAASLLLAPVAEEEGGWGAAAPASSPTPPPPTPPPPSADLAMSGEEALLWRVVTSLLADKAAAKGRAAAAASGAPAAVEAAAAGDCLSALEAALPACVSDMAALVRGCVAAADAAAGAGDAAAAGGARFAARQLLRTASAAMDLADAAGRAAAVGLLADLLARSAAPGWLDGAWADALAGLAGAAAARPAEAAPPVLASINAWLPLAGGGDASSPATSTTTPATSPVGSAPAWRSCLAAASLLLRCTLPARAPRGDVFGEGGPGQAPPPPPGARLLRVEPDLRAVLVAPALCHVDEGVRADAARAAGLLALATADAGEAAAALALLRAGAAGAGGLPGTRARAAAVEALADAALVRGPRALDAMHAALVASMEGAGPLQTAPALSGEMADLLASPTPPPPATPGVGPAAARPAALILCDALASVDDPDPTLRTAGEAAAEGLAKLLLHRSAPASAPEPEVAACHAPAALARLLGIIARGDAASAPRARQVLAVFFPLYAAAGPRPAAFLAAAALPAARTAAAGSGGAGGKASAIASSVHVLRYVGDVLSCAASVPHSWARARAGALMRPADEWDGAAAGTGCALLSEAARVAGVPSAKGYAGALVSLAGCLPPPPRGAPADARLAAAAAAAAAALPSGTTAARDAAALARRYGGVASRRTTRATGDGGDSAPAPQEEDAMHVEGDEEAAGLLAEAVALVDGGEDNGGPTPAVSGVAHDPATSTPWAAVFDPLADPCTGALPFATELGGGRTAGGAASAGGTAAANPTTSRPTRARRTAALAARVALADDEGTGSESEEEEVTAATGAPSAPVEEEEEEEAEVENAAPAAEAPSAAAAAPPARPRARAAAPASAKATSPAAAAPTRRRTRAALADDNSVGR